MNLFKSIVCAGIFAAAVGAQAQSTHVFMFAHADDTTLFAGDYAFRDMVVGNNCIFIYVSAGEGGLRAGGSGTIPFYRARELSATSTVKVATTQSGFTTLFDTWSKKTFNGHSIDLYKYRNSTSYFLRLPDGEPGGGGYPANGNQSLGRVYINDNPKIQAVDSSTTYNGWVDLANTIKAIISSHTGSTTGFLINAQDPDPTININDHSDHRHTGLLALDAGTPMGARFRLWQDYIINTKPANLGRDDFMKKTGMHGALAMTLATYGYLPTYDDWHTSFLDRSYFRYHP